MISVVIPAYNESGAIEGTVRSIMAVLEQTGLESEVLVVDDGSSDRTGEEAAAAGARVLRNPHNLGYGWSLKRGIAAARHDMIVITDADLTYPADQIPALLSEKARGFDMVVGQRTGSHYRESFIKSPLRRILRFLVEYAADRHVPDINSGMRIFDRRTAMSFFSHLCNTFSFTTSMTLAYMMNGKFVSYVPIPYLERHGRSKVRLMRDSLRTLQYIVEAVIFFNPFKAFVLLATITFLAAIASFVLGMVTSLHIFYFLGIGGLMLSVLTICLGFLAVLLKQIMQRGTGSSLNGPEDL